MPPTKSSKKEESQPSLFSFLFSRALLSNLALALCLIILVGLGVMQILRSYTGHNRYITVPDCQGMLLPQAAEMLERRDLRWAVMDSLYDPKLLPLSIIAQYPGSPGEVKRGRVIHLTVNKTRPQMIQVPVAEVLEKTLRSVTYNLQSKGFKIGELIYQSGPYTNQVVELRRGGAPMALKPGENLPLGATIDLVVTDGYGSTRLLMPDLTGMGLLEAQFVLRANNLVEGTFFLQPGVDSTYAAVYRQEPSAGPDIFVREGTMVNLWLGFGDEGEE